MTILITATGIGYILSISDTRISVQSGNTFKSVDEHFNKHIVFHSDGFMGDLSYTGLAQWDEHGQTIKMYDVISESISQSAKASLAFGPLALNLTRDILDRLEKPRLAHKLKKAIIELHIVGRHKDVPYPFIGVISTFREKPPWTYEGEFQWEYHFNGIHSYLKFADKPELVIGGMDTAIRFEEKQRLLKALTAGGGSFEISQMVKCLVERAAMRNKAIGPRIVAILIPETGFLDTNLWDKVNEKIVAFLPRIIFPNGMNWGPSEFPVDLSLIMEGHLPRQSIFFKSIVVTKFKKSIKRRIFRNRKGKSIPGIIGIIGLALFGKVPEGYSDFGLGS